MRTCFILVLLFLAATSSAQKASRSVRIDDDSDWWSLMKTDEPLASKAQPVRTPNASLEILGISLLDQHLSATIAKRLGPVVEVERGDAATGRHQYCYSSSGLGSNVHLIFEFGEVESALYLFSGAPDWKGSRYCKLSKLLSDRVGTPSGLRLGITRAGVEAILGRPTLVKNDRIVYVRSLSVKSTPQELRRARTYAPDMSEKEFQTNYGHWDFATNIVARFKDSKLCYLAILQDETL